MLIKIMYPYCGARKAVDDVPTDEGLPHVPMFDTGKKHASGVFRCSATLTVGVAGSF